MNILFLTPRDSRKNLGGVEGHVRLLTEELVKRGHKVEELSLISDTNDTNRHPNDTNNTTQSVNKPDKFKSWVRLWRNRRLFRWADVIHVHDVFWWYAPFAMMNRLSQLPQYYAYLLPWSPSTRRKSASTGYGRTSDFFQIKKSGPSVFTTFHGWEGVCPPTRSAVWQKRLAQKLSQGTIGVGNFYEKWYGVRPDRIVWGCAEKIKKLEKKKDGKKRGKRIQIVFLGRMEEVNGVEVVVEALEKLKKIEKKKDGEKRGKRKSEFIFIGDGSYKKQAEKFGKVTGMVKNPQKYLADADVVITSSYMSMLEAAAMGKPIIAIANNELKMDYLNCHPLRKYIMVARNADELIDEIKKLKINKDWEKRGKRWAVGQTAGKLADVYEGLWG